MKVLVYCGNAKKIEKSGIGRALKHQLTALNSAGVSYTLNPKDNYDLIHITNYLSGVKKIIKHAKKRNIPLIIHAHSSIEDFVNSFRFWKLISKVWFNRFLYWYFGTADLILAPTLYTKKLIESYGLNKKVIAISNGIDVKEYENNDKYVNDFKKRFNITNEKVVMGVGFFFVRKGILDFFEIARRCPNIKFIWFGHLNKLLTESKVNRAIKNRPSNVIMAGYNSGEIIKGAYKYSSAVLYPSFEENEGIVALEALASKCPLLVRDIGVYKDWLKDNVNCFKANNVDEFVDKINYIINNDVSKVCEEGFKIAKSKTLDIIGKQLKEIYTNFVNEYKNNINKVDKC